MFNQLALTVTDRRGSMRDDRASRLTVSAVLSRLEINELLKSPVAKMAELKEDAIACIEEKLADELKGVVSSKYVDMVPDEFSYDSE